MLWCFGLTSLYKRFFLALTSGLLLNGVSGCGSNCNLCNDRELNFQFHTFFDPFLPVAEISGWFVLMFFFFGFTFCCQNMFDHYSLIEFLIFFFFIFHKFSQFFFRKISFKLSRICFLFHANRFQTFQAFSNRLFRSFNTNWKWKFFFSCSGNTRKNKALWNRSRESLWVKILLFFPL